MQLHSVLLLSLWPAASCATAASGVAGAPTWQEGLQGVMLLAAVLPKRGPGPGRALEAKMQRAGSLVYRAYGLLQTATQSVEEAREQVGARVHVGKAASNLAAGEDLMRRAGMALQEGQRLQREAEAALQSSADPLGAPPEEPQGWAQVDAMARRTVSKQGALRGAVEELRHLAGHGDLSLPGAASARSQPADPDPVTRRQDDELLAILAKY